MKRVKCNNTELSFDAKSLAFSVTREGETWNWDTNYCPKIQTKQGTIHFQDAETINHSDWKTGLGEGVLSHYEGFTVDGVKTNLAFDTIAWIESVSGDVFFEFIPLCESGVDIEEVFWPGNMEFDCPDDRWYTLLNVQQGLLIPNTWETALEKLLFDGMLCTAGSYMPWFGQVKNRAGYIAVCEQPWDASYYAEHPANGPYTHVGIKWRPSLGTIHYKRSMKYSFLSDCDYNDLCKIYRTYVKEKGTFRSLAEKACKAPVDKLIGSAFVHKGIKTKVMPDSEFFDPADPEKNNNLTTFDTRSEEIRHIHDDLGVEKLYLHLDGWAEPGYDNQHPDYLPACEEAGGWKGMKKLADTIHDCGYLFGIHDQYRDYYFAAKTFDESFGCRQTDGKLLEHSRWAGGHQTYLCATQAPSYVKRNFSEIAENGVDLDCAYLDVFTCNEGDECTHPWHKMSRRECHDYRNQCFEYLLSKGILPSSEEVTDWSIPSLVFSHYAPYNFMMEKPGTPRHGIPVPLYNLVYHDCTIIPWMMEKMSETEDFMLYALLNGGAPYLIRDGAYQNVDGSFDGHIQLDEKEMAARCKIVCDLHTKIAKCEMVSHEFLDGDINRQQTTFSDGTKVKIDLKTLEYEVI